MVQRTALSSAEPDIRSAVTIRVAAQITLFGRGTGGHAANHVGTHNGGYRIRTARRLRLASDRKLMSNSLPSGSRMAIPWWSRPSSKRALTNVAPSASSLAEDLLDCCLPGGLCPGHGRLASGGQRKQGGAREIRDDIHEAFLSLASAIMCWRRLRNLSLC